MRRTALEHDRGNLHIRVTPRVTWRAWGSRCLAAFNVARATARNASAVVSSPSRRSREETQIKRVLSMYLEQEQQQQ
ncbi:unnamed protein product [Lampetra fluviatilis]